MTHFKKVVLLTALVFLAAPIFAVPPYTSASLALNYGYDDVEGVYNKQFSFGTTVATTKYTKGGSCSYSGNNDTGSVTESITSDFGYISDASTLKVTTQKLQQGSVWTGPTYGLFQDTLIIGSKAVGSTPALPRGTPVNVEIKIILDPDVSSGGNTDTSSVFGLYYGQLKFQSYGLHSGQYSVGTLKTQTSTPWYGLVSDLVSSHEVTAWVGGTVTITGRLVPGSQVNLDSASVAYNANFVTYVTPPSGVTFKSLSGCAYTGGPAARQVRIQRVRQSLSLWTELLPEEILQ
jgi:hypothetical protein